MKRLTAYDIRVCAALLGNPMTIRETAAATGLGVKRATDTMTRLNNASMVKQSRRPGERARLFTLTPTGERAAKAPMPDPKRPESLDGIYVLRTRNGQRHAAVFDMGAAA